jgi:hypothetical protein
MSSNKPNLGPLTSNKLVSSQLTSNKLALNKLSSNKLASNKLTSNKLALNKLTSNKLASNKLTSNKLASNKLTSNKPKLNEPDKGLWNFIFYVLLMLLAGFIILLLLFLVQYLRTTCGPPGKMNYWSYLSGMNINNSPCNPPLPEKVFEERELKQEKEVFHISDQIYTYPESIEKCRAYDGAQLATYDQIVKYYNDGGSFLNYGWSQGQNAYYPIQPCDYVKLRRQGIHIGPPGVNGGKFPPHIRFGANCYGVKPKGHVIKMKEPICDEKSQICQRNPDACQVLKSDRIDPFIPEKQWSEWGDK